MRTLIVHNTRSGFGSDAIFEFERCLVSEGDECVFRTLSKDQPVAKALHDAESFDLVVLSAGDGTVAAALYALRHRDVLACIFPSGTANLIASAIGNAAEPAVLARACRNASFATCDLGELSWTDSEGRAYTHGFGLMAGTGYDAQLMAVATAHKRTRGEVAYFTAALSNLRPEVHHFCITVDGSTYERDGIACLVANSSTIQGGIELSPGCSMTDGLIDVIVLECEVATQLLRPFFHGLVDRRGNALGRPHIETFRGSRIHVESANPMHMEIDGDVMDGMVCAYDAHALPSCVHIVIDELSHYSRSAK